MIELPWEVQSDAGDLLRGLLAFAVPHAIELLDNQEQLLPMVITFAKGQHNVAVLTAPSKKPNLMAKEYIANLPEVADAYVVILQGGVETKSGVCDAVIVLGGERSQAHGYSLAQAYQRDAARKVTLVGDLRYGGHVEQFLRRS